MIKKCFHVAVIDDGVNGRLFDIDLFHNLVVMDDLSIIPCKSENENMKTHGTLCAAIIKAYAEADLVISSIKILGNRRIGSANKLYRALEWCMEHKVDIANLSLGSCSFLDYTSMRKTINDMYDKGLMMICASHNLDYFTYPATLANVIGVKCDKKGFLSFNEWVMNEERIDGTDIVAFSKHELLTVEGTVNKCGYYNSYAAPMITAKVIPILNKFYSLEIVIDKIEYIREELYKKSKRKTKNFFHFYHWPDWIRNASIVSVLSNINEEVPYYFNCINKICVNNEQELFFYFQDNTFEHEDTIVIYSNNQLSEVIIGKIRNITNYKGISLIFADEANVHYNYNNSLGNVKHWYPRYKEFVNYYDPSITYKIDAPFLLVIGEDNSLVLTMINKLAEFFAGEKYCALLYSNRVEGIFYECEYLPDIVLTQYIESVLQDMNRMTLKKCADLSILGVTFEYTKLSNRLKKNIDIKIKISKSRENRNQYSCTIESEDFIICKENNSLDLWVKDVFDCIKEKLEEQTV